MIVHPPLLYTGYVGFSVAFAFAIAALLERRVDAQWVRWSRPWTNVAWAFLTLGIALGSFWAYYELGWGGWWFWDPVENASFMPWLVGWRCCTRRRSAEKRGSFRGWTLLLAIAAFSLSLLGTFLVRSGVLTSVHAFASDPQRGLFILGFLTIVVGGSLALYAWRAPRDENAAPFACRLARNTAAGQQPAAQRRRGDDPDRHAVSAAGRSARARPHLRSARPTSACCSPLLMAPLVLLVPFGPLTRWQREQPSTPMRWLLPWAVVALLGAALTFGAWPAATWRTVRGLAAGPVAAAGHSALPVASGLVCEQKLTAEMLGMVLSPLRAWPVLLRACWSTESTELSITTSPRSQAGFECAATNSASTRRAGRGCPLQRASAATSRDARRRAGPRPWGRKSALRPAAASDDRGHITAGCTGDLYGALATARRDGSWALRLYVETPGPPDLARRPVMGAGRLRGGVRRPLPQAGGSESGMKRWLPLVASSRSPRCCSPAC
jgi:cytochrome c-type biogenesis protein CcmF